MIDDRGRRREAANGVRRLPAGAVNLLLAAIAIVAAGAGCAGDAAREPTIPSVDFTPKLVLTVDDDALDLAKGPRADDAVTLDPATVPSGSVVDIVNRADGPRRLVGNDGKVFDTGIVRPGGTATVVLSTTDPNPLTVNVKEKDGHLTTAIVVRPT